MQVFLLHYPAGFTDVWHTHPHAHGIRLIDGVLNTRRGESGPGSSVWFPEGGWTEHGATRQNDVTFLFVTNNPFAIEYEGDPDLPYPMHG